MDAARKNAYRDLIHSAMSRIRALLSIGAGHPEERLRADCAYVIADLMHNLARYSALDFDGFDEEWYWHEAAHAAKFDELIADFGDRGYFEQCVSEIVVRELPGVLNRRVLLNLPMGWRHGPGPDDSRH